MATLNCTIKRTKVPNVTTYYLKAPEIQHNLIREPIFIPLPSKGVALPQYRIIDLGHLQEQIVISGIVKDADAGGDGNPISKLNLEDVIANWWQDIDYAAKTSLHELTTDGRTWKGYVERADMYQTGGEPFWSYRILFKSLIPPDRP